MGILAAGEIAVNTGLVLLLSDAEELRNRRNSGSAQVGLR